MVRRIGRAAEVLAVGCRVAFRALDIRSGRRKQRLHLVMQTLAHEAVSVSELAARTQLGQAIYPLLAELKRDGFVGQGWTTTQGGPRLVYWLTPEGLEQLASM